MANPKHSGVSGVFGVAAGLGTTLPAFICAGGACASCFACVGTAGAMASVILARLALRARPGPAGDDAALWDSARKENSWEVRE